jgi:GntR family transcriptional regulator
MTHRFRIQPNSELPIFGQIVEQVRQGIARGALAPGERIPTVRDLARELLVNPNTVSKAYQQMERDRLIVTRRGAGTFIAPLGCDLKREERERQLDHRVAGCLTEAVHLGFTRDATLTRFETSMEEYRWPERETNEEEQA